MTRTVMCESKKNAIIYYSRRSRCNRSDRIVVGQLKFICIYVIYLFYNICRHWLIKSSCESEDFDLDDNQDQRALRMPSSIKSN